MMTAAVSAMRDDVRARAIELTRTFDDFTPDDDPPNEHDFGSFEIDDQKFIFKHDYTPPVVPLLLDDGDETRPVIRYGLHGQCIMSVLPLRNVLIPSSRIVFSASSSAA